MSKVGQPRSQGLRGETVTKTLVKFVLSFQNFGEKIACAVRHNRIQPLLQYGCIGTIKRNLPGSSSPSHREGPGTEVESWAAAHGLYRCAVYRLLSEPMSTRLLNSISSRICLQSTQFNMYTTTSKQQEGCTFKDSHPKCFITTNFHKFHREAFARGDESRRCFDSMFP